MRQLGVHFNVTPMEGGVVSGSTDGSVIDHMERQINLRPFDVTVVMMWIINVIIIIIIMMVLTQSCRRTDQQLSWSESRTKINFVRNKYCTKIH